MRVKCARRRKQRDTISAAAQSVAVAYVEGSGTAATPNCMSMPSEIAGGIILFLFALKMLFGGLDSKPGSPEPGRDLAVFPLAVPSIAGPGAIMAVILLTDNDVYTLPQQAETGIVLLVVLLLTYIFLRFSDFILRIIGQQGAAVLVRVMGIILASLAVEIVLTALAVGDWGPARK